MQCTTYFTDNGLQKWSRLCIQERRDKVAAHMWMGGGSSRAKAASAVPEAPSASQQASATQQPSEPSGPACSGEAPEKKDSKSEPAWDLPKKRVSESANIEDVTLSLFKRSKTTSSQGEETGAVLEDQAEGHEVFVPHVTFTKFLEAVNLSGAPYEADIFGSLLAHCVQKGKHKGKWVVRSLFVPDRRVDDAKNREEHELWLQANQEFGEIGRHGWDEATH